MPTKAPAVAPAPPPSPWDIAFGAAIMNDYIFRGVTQSGHKPSVAAYFEPRYNINSNWQLYAGLSGESIKFANNAAAEIDFYGGVRSTWGPLAFDVGYWYYYYPGGQCYGTGPTQSLDPGCLNGNLSWRASVERQRRQDGRELLRSLRQGRIHLDRLGLRRKLLLVAELPEYGRRWRISVGHNQVHRARENGAWSVGLVRVG